MAHLMMTRRFNELKFFLMENEELYLIFHSLFYIWHFLFFIPKKLKQKQTNLF